MILLWHLLIVRASLAGFKSQIHECCLFIVITFVVFFIFDEKCVHIINFCFKIRFLSRPLELLTHAMLIPMASTLYKSFCRLKGTCEILLVTPSKMAVYFPNPATQSKMYFSPSFSEANSILAQLLTFKYTYISTPFSSMALHEFHNITSSALRKCQFFSVQDGY